MRHRIIVPEAMDDPGLDPVRHQAALRGLARLNRVSRVAQAMYGRLRKMTEQSPRPLRVLDIATGSGDIPIAWMQWAQRDQFLLEVTGADISPQAISVASNAAHRLRVDADWIVADALEDSLPNDFDVVTCSLFLHHLHDDDIVRLLRIMRDATDAGGLLRRLLICDLDRSRTNLCLVTIASQLLSRSPVVHLDARLSVRAAMTRREFAAIVETALLISPKVERLFPCRFISEIPLD
jgi:ubiquinone/menaquinone biosynthesis C-methylase UbiE